MITDECVCTGKFGDWNPDCSIHGKDGRIWPSESLLIKARGEVRSAMCGA